MTKLIVKAPDSRRGAVSFVLRDTFYVLGGYTAVGLDARLHALDLAGEKWSAQGAPGAEAAAPPPPAPFEFRAGCATGCWATRTNDRFASM